MTGQPAPDTDMALDRVEAFSDGVFAVAVTLLILNLQVPHLKDSPSSELVDTLVKQWPSYLSYAVAFLTLGSVWVSHHQMLRYFDRADSTLQTLNVLFLMFITLTPFTTALLGEYIQQTDKLSVTLVIFGAVWVVNGFCFSLMWRYAVQSGILKASVTPTMIRNMTISASFGSIFSVFASILALFLPQVSLILFVAIAFGYTGIPLIRAFRPRLQPATTTASKL